MKNAKKLAGAAACVAAMLSTMSVGAAAEGETLMEKATGISSILRTGIRRTMDLYL